MVSHKPRTTLLRYFHDMAIRHDDDSICCVVWCSVVSIQPQMVRDLKGFWNDLLNYARISVRTKYRFVSVALELNCRCVASSVVCESRLLSHAVIQVTSIILICMKMSIFLYLFIFNAKFHPSAYSDWRIQICGRTDRQTDMDPSYKRHWTLFFFGVQSSLVHLKLYFPFISKKKCDFKLFDSLVTALLLLS